MRSMMNKIVVKANPQTVAEKKMRLTWITNKLKHDMRPSAYWAGEKVKLEKELGL